MYELRDIPRLEILAAAEVWLSPIWGGRNYHSPFWRLYQNDRAGARVLLDGQEWEMSPDSLYLIPAGTPFYGEVDDDGPIGHFWIHFRAGRFYDRTAPGVHHWRMSPLDRQLIGRLRKAVRKRRSLGPELYMAMTCLISQGLCRIPTTDLGQSTTEPRVQEAIRLVYERPDAPLDVAALADHVGLSRPAFTRLFRRATGETPHRYLLQMKLEQARQALETTDRSVEQIAADLGFSDRFHLTRHFSRGYGVAPAAHRRAFRGLQAD